MFDITKVPSQKGRIAIVTGANAGLGYETALALGKLNAKVIMACRNVAKAQSAKQAILAKVPQADLEVMELDLSSLKSVRAFAAAYLAKYDRLDLLINNAGIMVPPFSKTEDGFESQMGANYFGHFLLTGLLLPTLNKTPHARVVALSSKAHESGKIDFDNLHAEKSYSRMGAYSQSKLACLMFAYELERRLQAAGYKTLSVAAHPGVSNTELGKHIPRVAYFLLMPIFALMIHSPENATLPQLMAALDPDVKGGEYFGPTGFSEMKGKPGKVGSRPQSHDLAVAKKLWEVSEKLTGFTYQF
jgi:NAD(P)-dependent dehydrogenase (short-subunit alcohol dehydrogenase family)